VLTVTATAPATTRHSLRRRRASLSLSVPVRRSRAPQPHVPVGIAGTFTVINSGSPAPALAETGALPTNVKFLDNANGTATISGTPPLGTVGSFPINITAVNAPVQPLRRLLLSLSGTRLGGVGRGSFEFQFGGSVLLTATYRRAKRARLTLSPLLKARRIQPLRVARPR